MRSPQPGERGRWSGKASRRLGRRRRRPGAARRSIDLEPLEPRLLLSSDFLPFAVDMATAGNDLTLRFDAAAQAVELVHNPSSAVVATRSLSSTSEVIVTGTDADDRLAFHASAVGLVVTPPAAELPADLDGDGVVGGRDVVLLSRHFGSSGAGVPGDANGDGVVGGADLLILGRAFGERESAEPARPLTIRFDAGAGVDALAGPDVDAIWSLTGAGAGEVAGLAFSGVERLEGAAANRDTFVFREAGSLRGSVDGGPLGYDALVVEGGSYAAVTYRATGGDSGVLDFDGEVIVFAGMEPVDLGTVAADFRFELSPTPFSTDPNVPPGSTDSDDVIVVRDVAGVDDAMEIASGSAPVTFESVRFNRPSASLTIDASAGDDSIAIESLDPAFDGELVVIGGAGDDALHGIAGTDTTYRFGDDWGDDTLEQQAGSARLEFAGFGGDLRLRAPGSTGPEIEGLVGGVAANTLDTSGGATFVTDVRSFEAPAQAAALVEGLEALADLGHRLNGFGPLATELLVLQRSIGEELGIGEILAERLAAPIASFLASSPDPTLEELVAALEATSGTIGDVQFGVTAVATKLAAGGLDLELRLDATRRRTGALIDLGADVEQVLTTESLSAELRTGFHWNVGLELGADASQSAIRFDAPIAITADLGLAAFVARTGFLGLDVRGSAGPDAVRLDADVALQVGAPGGSSPFADLPGLAITESSPGTALYEVDATALARAGVSGIADPQNPAFVRFADDLLDDQPPTTPLDHDFDALGILDFLLTDSGVVRAQLRQFGAFLDTFATTTLGIPIPLTRSTTLRDVFPVGDVFRSEFLDLIELPPNRADTLVRDLNDGSGVRAVPGNDIRVTLRGGQGFEVDLDHDPDTATLGDLVDRIGSAAGPLVTDGFFEVVTDPSTGALILVDRTEQIGSNEFTVQAVGDSQAASDLGLDAPGAAREIGGEPVFAIDVAPNPGPNFDTIQELLALAALGPKTTVSTAHYAGGPGGPTLQFLVEIVEDALPGVEDTLALFDLGPLRDLSTSDPVTLTPEGILHLPFEIELSEVGFELDESMPLRELNAGRGVRSVPDADDIRVQLLDGTSFAVDLSVDPEGRLAGGLGLGTVAGDDILLQLNDGTAFSVDLNGDAQTGTFGPAETVGDLAQRIRDAAAAAGVAAGDFEVVADFARGTLVLRDRTPGSAGFAASDVGGSTAAADLDLVVPALPGAGALVLEAPLVTLGDVLARIRSAAASAGLGPTQFSVRFDPDRTGVLLVDATQAAPPLSGTATEASSGATLVDANAFFGAAGGLAGRTAFIVAGTGAGQSLRIVGNSDTTLTLEAPWETPIGADSEYEIPTTSDVEAIGDSFARVDLGLFGPGSQQAVTAETLVADANWGLGVRTVAGADLEVRLRSGASFEVDLDHDPATATLETLAGRIRDAAAAASIPPQDFEVVIDATGALSLVDRSTPAAGNEFEVLALAGSPAARDLGLDRPALQRDVDFDGTPELSIAVQPPTLAIGGGPLHGDTPSAKLGLRQDGGAHVQLDATLGASAVEASGLWGSLAVRASDGALDAATSSVAIDLTFVDAQLRALTEGLADPMALIDSQTAAGAATLELPLELASPLPGVGTGPANLRITLPDFSDPDALPTLEFTDAIPTDTQVLLEAVEELEVGDLLQVLEEAADYLVELETGPAIAGRDNPLALRVPGLNRSLGQLLGFGGAFRGQVEAVRDDPAPTLTGVEDALDALAGIAAALSFDPATRALALELDLDLPELVTQLPLVLDLTALGVDLASLGLEAASVIVDSQQSSPLDVTAHGSLHVALGIDLADPSNPVGFLFDTTEGSFDLRAAGAPLDFDALFGSIAVEVANGSYALDLDGAGAGSDPAHYVLGLAADAADGRHLFSEAGAATELDLDGAVDAVLPIVFPEAISGPANTDLTVSVGDLGDAAHTSSATGPRVDDLVGQIDLSQNLDSFRLGFDELFAELDELLDRAVFGQALPLVGTQLSDAIDLTEQIRAKVSDNLVLISTGLETDVLTPGEVRQALFDALGPGGLGWLQDRSGDGFLNLEDDILLGASSSEVVFDLDLLMPSRTLEAPIDLDLLLPGLGLETDAPLRITYAFSMPLLFGISVLDGVFLDVSALDEIAIDLDVALPEGAFDAELGFLPYRVLDLADVEPDVAPTRLQGAYTIDLRDLGGNANNRLSRNELLARPATDSVLRLHSIPQLADLHLRLETDLPEGAAFPPYRMDLNVTEWSFSVGSDGVSWEETTPRVAFDDVQFELVGFMRDFIGAAATRLRQAFEPLDGIIDFLNSEAFPILSLLFGRASYVSAAGTFGGVAEIGNFAAASYAMRTLVEGGQPFEADIFTEFFQDVFGVAGEFDNITLPPLADLAGEVWIDLGSFTVDGAAARAGSSEPPKPLEPTSIRPYGTIDDPPMSLSGRPDLTFDGRTIERPGGGQTWEGDGFVVGQAIEISGSGANDGSYRVMAVTATALTVDRDFVGEGPVSGVEIEARAVLTQNPQLTFARVDGTIQRGDGRTWASDGFTAGHFVEIRGSVSNDGIYRIADLAGHTIHVSETLTDEGPKDGVAAQSRGSILGKIVSIARDEGHPAHDAANGFLTTQLLPGRGSFDGVLGGSLRTVIPGFVGIDPVEIRILQDASRSFDLLLGETRFDSSVLEENVLLDYGTPELFLLLYQDIPLNPKTFAQAFIGPIGVLNVLTGGLFISISFEARADFALSWDATGLELFRITGNPDDLAEGFYFDDREGVEPNPAVIGNEAVGLGARSFVKDEPEVRILGGVGLGYFIQLDLAIAKLKVGAEIGLFLGVDYNFEDPDGDGQIRASEFDRLVGAGARPFTGSAGPLNSIFGTASETLNAYDLGARIEVRFDIFAKLKAFFFTIFDIRLNIVTLGGTIDLARDPIAAPILASLDGDVLRLNIGDRAPERLFAQAEDVADEEIFIGRDGSLLIVSGFGQHQAIFAFGIESIVGSAGSGNDRIVVSDDLLIPVTLHGGAGEDALVGGGGPASLFGDGGADVIVAGAAALASRTSPFRNRLEGGEGDDWILGGNDVDRILGGPGDDRISGGRGPDEIDGGDGIDTIDGGVGSDLIRGGDGADWIGGGLGSDAIFGGEGADVLWGGDGRDSIDAGGGADLVHGGLGNDSLRGGLGVDRIFGDQHNDLIAGGAESDQLDGGGATDRVFGDGGPFPDAAALGAPAGDDAIFARDGNDLLDGEGGSDTYLLSFVGGRAISLVTVLDTGSQLGTDLFSVEGTPFDDRFLLRANTDGSLAFVALLNQESRVERIDHTGVERAVVNAGFGDDEFAVDDTAAEMTLNGEAGDDRFQIGQLFRSRRTHEAASVSVRDEFATIETTRGFLSDGISAPMTVNGGLGDDHFVVFHNKAVLTLRGDQGDDLIEVRAFALAGSQEPQRERTDISGGAGADRIEYAVNAPVSIDGGDDADTLVVIGTEFGDDFVVTEDGIFGAGLTVSFVNIELLRVDAAEGDDRFFVRSTSEKFVTELFGGLGSDTFHMSGDTPPIVSNDLRGHSGIVLHDVESSDPLFDGQKLFGISANVADDDEPFAVIRQTGGSTIVTEGEAAGDGYEIVLTRRPTTDVFIQALAPVPTPDQRERGALAFRVSSPSPTAVSAPNGTSVTLVFTPENWFLPQTVEVRADMVPQLDNAGLLTRPELGDSEAFSFDDAAFEGVRFGVINHLVLAGSQSLDGSVLGVVASPTLTIANPSSRSPEAFEGKFVTVTLADGVTEQRRFITSARLVAGGLELVVDRAWRTGAPLPDGSSTFQVELDGGVEAGSVLAATNPGVTIPDPGAASLETLLGRRVEIASGSGAGQSHFIVAVEAVAGGVRLTVDRGWSLDDVPSATRLVEASETQRGEVFAPNVLSFHFDVGTLAPVGPGTLVVSAVADLDLSSEFLHLEAEDVFTRDLFVTGGSQGFPVTTAVELSQEQLESLVADGRISFSVTPSTAVGSFVTNNELTLELSFAVPDSTFLVRIDDALVGRMTDFDETPSGLPPIPRPDDQRSSFTDSSGGFPTAGEGLTGAILQLVGGPGAGQERLILGHLPGDPAHSLILNGPWSTDPVPGESIYRIERFDGLALPSLQVQVNDDDAAGLIVDETRGIDDGAVALHDDTITALIEGSDGDQLGERDVVRVRLSREPDTTVRVDLLFDGAQLALEAPDGTPVSFLEFTGGPGGNWNTFQTVVVAASDDLLREGFHASLIEFEITLGDGDATVTGQQDVFEVAADEAVFFVGLRQLPSAVTGVEVDGVALALADAQGLNGEYQVIGNKVLFVDATGREVRRSGEIAVGYEYVDAGFVGALTTPVLARLQDDDSPTVLVRESGGSTDVVELAPSVPPAAIHRDSYELVLTGAPDDAVTVTVTPEITKTTRTGGIRHDEIQVAISSADLRVTEEIVDGVATGNLLVVFGPADWDDPVQIDVRALDDDFVDGGDTQVFAPGPNTVSGILGPVFLDGAGGAGSIVIGEPVLLPGETNERTPDGAVLAFSPGTGEGALESMTVATDSLEAARIRLGLDTLDDLASRTLEVTRGPGLDRFWEIAALAPGTAGQHVLSLRNPSGVDPDLEEAPGEGSLFAITNLSLNFFVDEATRVDFLFVHDEDSPADSSGVLTATRLSGLGMGPDLVIDGVLRPGGISYGNLEAVEIDLGRGFNDFQVLGTHRREDGFQTWTLLNTGDDVLDPHQPDVTGDHVTVVLTEADGAFALDLQGGDDFADASASTLPLVIFGGDGADRIRGGSADDVLVGDRGRVDTFDESGRIVTRLGDAPEPIVGTVTGAGAATLVDAGASFPTGLEDLRGLVVAITDGTGAGQTRVIVGNTATELALDEPWLTPSRPGEVAPDASSVYRISTLPEDQTDGVVRPARRLLTLGSELGGDDVIRGGPGEDVLVGGAADDAIDGGGDADLIVGDELFLNREGALFADFRNPRFRSLAAGETTLYDPQGNPNVDAAQQLDPVGDPPVWADWEILLLHHSVEVEADPRNRFGDDSLAGGAGADTIFGQLGDDAIQGDGSIDLDVRGTGASAEDQGGPGSDGDDYVEGGGGDDLIFGNLGQDDLIGGSSNLFSLSDPTDAERDRALRPDGSDVIFGGAGTDAARNHPGDASPEGHARDADAILGDNGSIFRILASGGAFEHFVYDESFGMPGDANFENRGTLRIIPRATELLDYTPGGVDFDAASQANDQGAADVLHGESGDDAIYGMLGPDVLFGEGQDDDLVGGTGHDWISGGTGRDGILGDDGRIATSRIDTRAEPLHGVAAFAASELDLVISTPQHEAVIHARGELMKTADLEPFHVSPAGAADALFDPIDADDVLYGGLGGDWVHGGSGDDAISGAEALPEYYAEPLNPGDVLGFGRERLGEFDAYDENAPRTKILVDEFGTFTTPDDPSAREFLLNFDRAEGPVDPRSPGDATFPGGRPTDGDDRLFGDHGNDWIVGGTGRDHLWGGWGDDLLNADDDHDSTLGGADPRANDVPDPDHTYEDIAFGGAGRDVLIANTGGDRLIDWVGEFNSYIVPFSPFGIPTVFRAAQPQVVQFLYDLSQGDGADPTLAPAPGDPRNGEPFGEVGLVTSGDAAWQDQNGGPADPQPGSGTGPRDVRVSSPPATGTFAVANAALLPTPGRPPGDVDGDGAVGGIDLLLLARSFGSAALAADLDGNGAVGGSDLVLLARSFGASRHLGALGLFELDLGVETDAGTAIDRTSFASGVGGIVFDYHGPELFKFAALREDTDEVIVGHYTRAEGFAIDAATPWRVDPGDRHELRVSVAGTAVSVRVDGEAALGHTFGTSVGDGPVGLLSLEGAYAIRVLLDDGPGDADPDYSIREIALDGPGG